jgi:hypothetical protein
MSSFRVESISAYDFAKGDLPQNPLRTCAAWQVHNVLTPDRAASYAKNVLEARSFWTVDPEGDIVTLGEAWYLHFENETTPDYFRLAKRSNELVDNTLGHLPQTLRTLTTIAVKSPVQQRQLWCGPGVHVIERKAAPYRKGGCVHFDTEGLREEHCVAQTPAVSVVLVLSAPEQSGLRVWDHRYDPRVRKRPFEDLVFAKPPNSAYVDVNYKAGDLIIFDSYVAHKILPSRGKEPRISLTLHAVQNGTSWESWF